ncbi:hypothetical protein [Deinococcus alpinitundrae]|uniref:WD40 domain-containing protein n=1 Tax=Deinococcus alpinitundrae TaxID=468913 RepID=UPI00137AE1CF|nr:hypothetical protein [Deinococcus alpinitundrae]
MNLTWASAEGELLLEGDFTHLEILEDQGQMVALGKGDLRLLDLTTFETLGTVKRRGHEASSIAVDPGKRRVFVGNSNRDEVEVIDLNSMSSLVPVKLTSAPKALVLGNRARRLWALSFGRITLVDVGEKKPKLSRTVDLRGDPAGRAAALSADESLLAVGREGKCEVYRTSNSALKLGFDVPPGLRTLAFSPSGAWLAGGGGTFREDEQAASPFERYVYEHNDVCVWNPDTGRLLFRGAARPNPNFITSIVWHPTLPLLASADTRGGILLWRVPEEGTELLREGELTAPPYAGEVKQVLFTGDGAHLLALRRGGVSEYRLEGVPSLKRTPDSPHHPAARLDLPVSWPTHAQWHGDGLWISGLHGWVEVGVSHRQVRRQGETNENTRIWISQPGHGKALRLRNVDDTEDLIEVRALDNTLLHEVARIPHIPYVPRLTMQLEEDGQAITYNVGGQLHHASLEPPFASTSAGFDDMTVTEFSFKTLPGSVLSTSGFGDTMHVRLWNTTTLASMLVLDQGDLYDFSGWLTSSALSPGGLIGIGSQKGEVGVFDLATGKRKFKGVRHGDGSVHDLAFSPDETLLASAAHDRTVRLWDVRSGEELAVLPHEHPVHLVTFGPGDSELVSVDQSGTAFFWELSSVTTWSALTAPAPAGDVLPKTTPPVAEEHPTPPVVSARPRQDREAYFEAARKAGLGSFAEQSWALYLAAPFEAAPLQGARHIVEAYRQAKTLAPEFRVRVQACAQHLKVKCHLRPGDLKDANRALEKMDRPEDDENLTLPIDLLGGSLVCSSLRELYEVASRLGEAFDVVGFRDRMIRPVAAGYRDLQFSVSLHGHVAEIKIMHELMAQVDRYEHKVFEIQRGIEAQNHVEMPFAEEVVTRSLYIASRRMYSNTWAEILAREGDSHA